jgi:hypothetical protein
MEKMPFLELVPGNIAPIFLHLACIEAKWRRFAFMGTCPGKHSPFTALSVISDKHLFHESESILS